MFVANLVNKKIKIKETANILSCDRAFVQQTEFTTI